MVVALESGLVGPDVPEPAFRCAMIYWKPVTMIYMKTLDKTAEILAAIIVKPKAYLEDALVREG